MIKVEEVINIHEILIEKFGGTRGIRDRNALESALSRPFMTFDQRELYPTPVEKAAALVESLIANHPFVDGNKRIGYFIMRYFLLGENIDIQATQIEKYDFVMKIAQGQSSFEGICDWLSQRVI
jgi:death on curing protein